MFERELLLWPGVTLAVLGALVLVFSPERRDHFWGYDLLGGVGAAAGGLLIYESERTGQPASIEIEDLFEGIFTGWPQAALVAVIGAGAALIAVIILKRGLPSWQRVLALTFGVASIVIASHLWSAGL